jgi:tetratricopeptide (TPR) repeat protein
VDLAGRDVALKVARGHGLELERRFRREAATLRALPPGVAPRLTDQGVLGDGRPYLALEWLSAPTLATWLEQRTNLPALEHALPIAQALLECARKVLAADILHRDLKPENLALFEDEGTPRVLALDFGSAQSLTSPSELGLDASEAGVSEAGAIIGTSEYLAPERILGERGDERSEIYTLGVILYELSTLRLPFVSRGRAVLHDQLALVPPPPSRWADVPEAWDDLLLSCLAKEPARRPGSVAELAERLEHCSRAPKRSPQAEGRRPEPRQAAAERAEPAALLLLEGVTEPLRVAAAIRELRGLLARVRGQRAVCVFSATECTAPLEAALEAALALAAQKLVARVGLHVGSVELHRAPDGATTARGSAVNRPESWCPDSAERPRVFVSAAAASALAEPSVRRIEGAFAALVDAPNARSASAPLSEDDEAPLCGRDGELAEIEASLASWQKTRDAAVAVVLGDSGTGKTRFARAVLERARRMPGVHAVLLGGRPGRGVVRARALREALPNSGSPLTHGAALRAQAERAPLVIVIDDAELAEDELLDEVEAALLKAPPAAIWVACVGSLRFGKARPLWGTRIEHFRLLKLEALSESAAKALAGALLRPAEYVPEEALVRVCRAAAHLPGPLVEITRAIRQAGLIRPRSTQASYLLDTAELARIPVPAMWQWAAARELGELEPTLAAGAKLVAILGPSVSRDELAAVQLGLRSHDTSFGAIESAVLLRRLVEAGLLLPSPDNATEYTFRAASLAEALASLVAPSERELVHRVALAYHKSATGSSERARVANHATALGERALASQAHRALAEEAAAQQRVVDAETHYTSAIAQSDDALDRGHLLIGRARVYCRMYRLEESERDLRAVIVLAEPRAAWELAARAQFELATVLDWAGDYAASADATRAALELQARNLGELGSAYGLVARGRAAWRRSEVEAAITLLRDGATAASSEENIEQRIIALLLLGCALVQAGQRREAEACFEDVLADAEAARDGLHLCAALGNRAFLWAVEGEPERCVTDLTRAVSVARLLGHPGTERTALLNLAEVLYWAGREDEAVVWLKQARHLEARFIQRALHSAVLLQARIALLRGQITEVRTALAWLAARGLPEAQATSAVAFHSAIVHVLRAGSPAEDLDAPHVLTWSEIADVSAHFLAAERAELEYFRLRSRWRAATPSERLALLQEAETICATEPAWLRRVRALQHESDTARAWR